MKAGLQPAGSGVGSAEHTLGYVLDICETVGGEDFQGPRGPDACSADKGDRFRFITASDFDHVADKCLYPVGIVDSDGG